MQAEEQTPAGSPETLRVMTFNILFRSARNPAGSWSERRSEVLRIIRELQPDVVGIQEAMDDQLRDLRNGLPEYEIIPGHRTGRSKLPFWSATLSPALFGAGWAVSRNREESTVARIAGPALFLGAALPLGAALAGWTASGAALVKGAFCPILYRRDRLRLLSSSDVWLSEKPDDPLTLLLGTWIPRVANRARLATLDGEHEFTFYNAHIDYMPYVTDGSLEKLRRVTDEDWDGSLQVLVGDFNNDLDSRECAYLTEPDGTGVEAPGFQSAWCEAQKRIGPEITLHHGLGLESPKQERADHIMCRPVPEILQAVTVEDHSDSCYPSDHFPLVTDFRLARAAQAEEGGLETEREREALPRAA